MERPITSSTKKPRPTNSIVLPQYLKVMCGLAGKWSGTIEIFDKTGEVSVSRLDSAHGWLANDSFLVEKSTLFAKGGASKETMQVSFPTGNENEFQISCFADSEERQIFVAAESAEIVDNEHWTTISTLSKEMMHEGNPARVRYRRARHGRSQTLVEEIQHSESSPDWLVRSRVRQELVDAVAAPAEIDEAAVRAEIWAKTLAILEGRSSGDVSYYYNNASPKYLAWTHNSKEPYGLARLAKGGNVAGNTHEKTSPTLTGFCLSGDTAIVYFRNHRTRTPAGKEVDEIYANMHVWQRTGGEWKVLASKTSLLDG